MKTLNEMIYELDTEEAQENKRDELFQEIQDIKDWIEEDLKEAFNSYEVERIDSRSITGGLFKSMYMHVEDVEIRFSDGHNNGSYSGNSKYDWNYCIFVENYNTAIKELISFIKNELKGE